MRVLLNSFHLNDHTLGVHPQTSLEATCHKQCDAQQLSLEWCNLIGSRSGKKVRNFLYDASLNFSHLFQSISSSSIHEKQG